MTENGGLRTPTSSPDIRNLRISFSSGFSHINNINCDHVGMITLFFIVQKNKKTQINNNKKYMFFKNFKFMRLTDGRTKTNGNTRWRDRQLYERTSRQTKRKPPKIMEYNKKSMFWLLCDNTSVYISLYDLSSVQTKNYHVYTDNLIIRLRIFLNVQKIPSYILPYKT